MKHAIIGFFISSLFFLTGCSDDNDTVNTTISLSNKEKAVALITAFETGSSKALDYISETKKYNKLNQFNSAILDNLGDYISVFNEKKLPYDIKNYGNLSIISTTSLIYLVFSSVVRLPLAVTFILAPSALSSGKN